MKKSSVHFLLILSVLLLAACQPSRNTVDLQERWDTIRPLENPDKGWYHHMLDNGIGKYLVQNESVLHDFPGMDHLYLRLAWAYLEPQEGVYNWEVIDTIIDKYVPMGFGISFRVSCKETGWVPNSIPVEINGVGYATPPWVRVAGAKGIVPSEFGPPVWTPDWDDPVFLEKLDNFHRVFAERYDGKPWVRYVDVGSIGEWGEGNAHRSTNIPPSLEEVKANIDVHLKHYTRSQLVVTDDLLYWRKPDSTVSQLLDYAVSKGITIRDDSPLVGWYVENYLDTWTVSHPHFYERVYRERPTVFELQHYGSVKRDGNWLGRNGEDTIPGIGVSGADMFRNSIRLIHPTYIGFHGYLGEWIGDNPDLTGELLNLCGYWYFPVSFAFAGSENGKLAFTMEWLNRGVAPAYNGYLLEGKLVSTADPEEVILFETGSGNIHWMPGEISEQTYEVEPGKEMDGAYDFSIRLFDERSGRPVEIGLEAGSRDEDGYYLIDRIKI
jgi:hypothetical protein